MYHIPLTPCTNYRAKTSNNTSEFRHSNCITMSDYPSNVTHAVFAAKLHADVSPRTRKSYNYCQFHCTSFQTFVNGDYWLQLKYKLTVLL